MESAIRRAVANEEFVLEFQPQINLDTHMLYGIEALVRWDHPQLGRVPPERFIPLAEECGLITDIDTWVLAESCRSLAAWDRAGIFIPSVAVNVSPRDFRNNKVPLRVEVALRQHGLTGKRLILEITESVMLNPSESTRLAFAALRSMGVRISIDDFGTGYSSLTYLKRFPVGELKLDRSFVADLAHDAGDRALAAAVIRVGKSMGLTVIAEGVETATQIEFLRSEQCDVAQGFFFSKPLPAADLPGWLARTA
jgi:EAL domain-containing protein (putative c-di-GMP-specific phosphodiesterase class I)